MFKNKIYAGFIIAVFPMVSAGEESVAKIHSPLGESGIKNIGQLLEVIVNAVTTVAIPIIVVALIWVGFKFVSAQGDTGQISDAKRTLWYTLGGAAIILGSNVILEVVVKTTETFMKF